MKLPSSEQLKKVNAGTHQLGACCADCGEVVVASHCSGSCSCGGCTVVEWNGDRVFRGTASRTFVLVDAKTGKVDEGNDQGESAEEQIWESDIPARAFLTTPLLVAVLYPGLIIGPLLIAGYQSTAMVFGAGCLVYYLIGLIHEVKRRG